MTFLLNSRRVAPLRSSLLDSLHSICERKLHFPSEWLHANRLTTVPPALHRIEFPILIGSFIVNRTWRHHYWREQRAQQEEKRWQPRNAMTLQHQFGLRSDFCQKSGSGRNDDWKPLFTAPTPAQILASKNSITKPLIALSVDSNCSWSSTAWQRFIQIC